ncbi:ABC-type multidrug transport system, ATPase and permease component [Propionibacterium cyclohexanicum]|uniref:ABC-type multidrug transport system, ATPase and permease component n=1 Tax=Propionibacterium cyclohexanicum TaxID=64702 RepID=A0A1H9RZ44_9ACTN|nr:ABC transporter ATP-binding protein [Propionibacterium cyclohexanicum]SER77655.1 ABC-type multidrug transport system, ATPase and permease component [Propionibacterium cyclohexanicum]
MSDSGEPTGSASSLRQARAGAARGHGSAEPPSAGRREVARWLVGVARPVLMPMAASTAARLVDQLAGLALFGLAMLGVLSWADAGGGALALLVLALVALSLVKALCRYLEQFLGHLVAFKALELLRVETFAALWPQAPAVLARSRSGDLLQRLTKDVDRVEVFFAHSFAPALTAVLTPLVAALTAGWLVSWPVAGVMAIGLALTVFLVPFLGAGPAARAATRSARTRGRLTHEITDSVQGVAEVTGYGLQDDRVARSRVLADRLGASGRVVTAVEAARAMVSGVVQWGTVVAMAVVGHHEGVGVAILAAVIVVALRCFAATRAVEDFLTDLDASFASAGRLWRVAHTPPAVRDPERPRALAVGPLDVVWQQVSFRYDDGVGDSGHAALDAVSCTAAAGEHTCIVGSSGAGKSTLVQLALRYADPLRGEVLVGGVDVCELALTELRAAISMVNQQPFFFAGSVADNLRLTRPDASDAELAQVCRQAHIDEHIATLAQGYGTDVGELAASWSGGQRARLALARALLTDARVFIVDEYTASLDDELAAELAASLRQARPDATLIEITHRVSSSLGADRVIVLDRGRCVQQGRPGELAASEGLYARMLAREADAVSQVTAGLTSS